MQWHRAHLKQKIVHTKQWRIGAKGNPPLGWLLRVHYTHYDMLWDPIKEGKYTGNGNYVFGLTYVHRPHYIYVREIYKHGASENVLMHDFSVF